MYLWCDDWGPWVWGGEGVFKQDSGRLVLLASGVVALVRLVKV